MCRTALIRSALESLHPDKLKSEQNVQIRHFWADMEGFRWPLSPKRWISGSRVEIEISSMTRFSKNDYQKLTGVPHGADSKCAGKFRLRRIKKFAKRANPTLLG